MRARSKTDEARGRGRNAPHPVDLHVGSRLRARRIVLGISQQKLAAALGLTFQQVYKYELGKNRISASRLYDFGKVLGVPITFFFEDLVDTSTPATLAGGEHTDALDSREGIELFAAYRAISDPVVRRRLRQLARALSTASNGSIATAARSQNRRPSRRVRTDRVRGPRER